MTLIEVDVLDPQPLERRVTLLHDVFAAQSAVVGARKRPVLLKWPEHLGAKDVRFATKWSQCASDDLLGPTPAVRIRRVEEVDSGFIGRAMQRVGMLLVGLIERQP